jgi:PAS domain S-box-containing protein
MQVPFDDLSREELIARLTFLEDERRHVQQQLENRQRVIASMSGILASSLDYEATLRSIVRLAVPPIADWCSVLLLDGETELRRVASASAFPEDTPSLEQLESRMPASVFEAATARMFLAGQSDLISDLRIDQLDNLTTSSNHRQAIIALGTRSIVRTPLMARNRTLGVIVFAYGRSGRRYSAQDLPILEEITHSAALAIDNAALYRATRRRLAELNTIQRVAQLINSTSTLDTIFHTIVDIISTTFGYRMVSTYVRDGDMLHLQASVGYDNVLSTITIDEGVSGRMLRSSQAVFVRDATQDPDFLHAVSGIQQGIFVPLKSNDGAVIGMLAVETVVVSLTEDDLTILVLLADQISVAVTNARLFRALRDSEQRYRTLVSQAADAILLTSVDWQIADANPQALRLFDATPAQLFHQSLLERCVLESADAAWPPQPSQMFFIRRFDQALCPVEASFSAVVTDGEVSQIVILRDITERMRAVELQRSTERQLLEAQKLESLGVLAGGIAHDFNNLLMAIMGNAGIAAVHLAPDSPLHEYMREIEVASRRATELTQQMLAYAGKARVVVHPIDLHIVIDGILPLLRSILGANITLRDSLAPDLPMVLADSAQIGRIVLSLVTNAAEAIGDQQPGVITISTSLHHVLPDTSTSDSDELAPGEYLALMVSDSGPGIDPAMRERIFEPFFSTKFAGRGLGLAAVQGIVRSHRGLLQVESDPGQGAVFRVLLPASSERPPESPPAAPEPDPAATRQRVVLVVDDEPIVRSTTARMIQQIGLRTLTSEHAQAALERLENDADQIDAVLLDLTMPHMNGFEAFQILAARYPALPVIVMSGHNADEARIQFGTPQPAHFLQKPFSYADLRSALAHVLGLPQLGV